MRGIINVPLLMISDCIEIAGNCKMMKYTTTTQKHPIIAIAIARIPVVGAQQNESSYGRFAEHHHHTIPKKTASHS
jgi:hypothetical protein